MSRPHTLSPSAPLRNRCLLDQSMSAAQRVSRLIGQEVSPFADCEMKATHLAKSKTCLTNGHETRLPEAYGKPDAEMIRECADVRFVPNEHSEKKDLQPLRYVAVRIRRRQGGLLEGAAEDKHFAVLTNIGDWKASRLLAWHREKAGTIEAVHDVLKNELSAGVLPCGRFGANAAWLRLAILTHNVLTALKRLALPAELPQARPKRLRFLFCNTAGRLVHYARRTILPLAGSAGRWTEYL